MNWTIFLIVFAIVGLLATHSRRSRSGVLDEREVLIRLQVNSFISRAVELTLVACIGAFILNPQLSALYVILAIGISGNAAQAFANSHYRKEASAG